MRALAIGLVTLGLWGCAKLEVPPPKSPELSSRPSAARMYQAAEAMVDAGYYGDAVRLVRHAVLSLPKTTDNDDLRHRLLMRMAHVQLLAAHAEGAPAHALDAATMLSAYGERHLALFGEARASEREDIYELLYEAEAFEEQLAQSIATAADAELVVVAEAEPAEPAIDTHAGEDLEPEFHRNVRVRRGWFYDPDDPRIRERLESDFSTPQVARVLTRPEYALLSPPRPMVRASGFPERIGSPPPADRDIRKLAREVLQAARPALRDCYRSAAARGGKLETRATLEFGVRSDGSIHDVRVVDGDVIDGLGEACVIEHLAQTTATKHATATRLRLPLLFFYDGAKYMYEGEHKTPRPEDRAEQPDISDFAVQPS